MSERQAQFFTVKQASDILHVTPSNVRYHIYHLNTFAIRCGGRWRVLLKVP